MRRREFEPNRQKAVFCPCGKRNNNGKFSPFVGCINEGYCFGCSKTFLTDSAKSEPNRQERKAATAVVPPSFISAEVLKQSLGLYDQNTLLEFIEKLTDQETAIRIRNEYLIGTSRFWSGATVFWQLDVRGKVRSGKIIQYTIRPDERCFIGQNCGRVKTNEPPVKWVHKLMKLKDYKLKQCFFGEHLLVMFPERKVGVLESEKSALIATAYRPDVLWLACGGASGLSEEKVKVLEGRNVTLFPDLGKFEEWKKKADMMKKQLPKAVIKTSDLLERMATYEERKQGLDLADFLIRNEWMKYSK